MKILCRVSGQRCSKFFNYVFGGLVFRSALQLPELDSCAGQASVDETIGGNLLCAADRFVIDDWLHHWSVDKQSDKAAVSLGRNVHGYILRFVDAADFLISFSGAEIELRVVYATPASTLRHLLLDQVLPRVLAHHGRLVLHAGAVQVDDCAIAFIGDSGMGKSTMVASFATEDFAVVCDDAIVFSEGASIPSILPTYPGIRLYPESIAGVFEKIPESSFVAHYSDKKRIRLGQYATTSARPIPLGAMFFLESACEPGDGDVKITRISARQAALALLENLYGFNVTDPRRVGTLFDSAATIANTVPAFSLSYPRRFASLADVKSAVLATRENWLLPATAQGASGTTR